MYNVYIYIYIHTGGAGDCGAGVGGGGGGRLRGFGASDQSALGCARSPERRLPSALVPCACLPVVHRFSELS